MAMTAPAIEREGFMVVEPAAIPAEDLIGATVYGPEDDSIAEISDVVLSAEGQVEHFLMDVGGFLGLGARTVAVGFDEATVLQEDGSGAYTVFVSATREQLEAMPAVE